MRRAPPFSGRQESRRRHLGGGIERAPATRQTASPWRGGAPTSRAGRLVGVIAHRSASSVVMRDAPSRSTNVDKLPKRLTPAPIIACRRRDGPSRTGTARRRGRSSASSHDRPRARDAAERVERDLGVDRGRGLRPMAEHLGNLRERCAVPDHPCRQAMAEQVGHAPMARRHAGAAEREAHDVIDRTRTRQADAWRDDAEKHASRGTGPATALEVARDAPHPRRRAGALIARAVLCRGRRSRRHASAGRQARERRLHSRAAPVGPAGARSPHRADRAPFDRSAVANTRCTSSTDKTAGTVDCRYVRTIGTADDRSRGVSPRRNRNRRTDRSETLSRRDDSVDRFAMRSRRNVRTVSASNVSSARRPTWVTRYVKKSRAHGA